MTFGHVPTRADDERLLAMVRRRVRGEAAARIGADYGMTKSAVLGATNRVLREDLAHGGAGDFPDEIRREYW